MKYALITLLLSICCTVAHSCSFAPIPFCETVNIANKDNVIIRGYFTDQELEYGLVFIRLETIKGNEERNELNIWDNLPFDCNGIHQRKASFMGNTNEEVIISIAKVDSIIYGLESFEDYRVPEGLWWETHFLKIVGDSVVGNLFYSPQYETVHYDEFIEDIIDNPICQITSIKSYSINNFNLYPTLANDLVFLEYTSIDPTSKMNIYNENGQLFMSEEIKPQINVATIPKGMYIVVIMSPDSKCFHKKFIKI